MIRRKLALVLAATSLALGLSLATADSADARRNLGGVTPGAEDCVQPAGALVVDRTASTVPCVCVDTPLAGVVRNTGRDPGAECPRGVLGDRTP